MLLELIAKETGLVAGVVTGFLVDCHIYDNHIDQVNEQLSRSVKTLPTLKFKTWDGFWNWKPADVIFEGYDPHPAIRAPVAV